MDAFYQEIGFSKVSMRTERDGIAVVYLYGSQDAIATVIGGLRIVFFADP